MGQPTKGDLTENEKKLMEKVSAGLLEEVKLLLKEPDVRVDCLDESGMTPLQHAAFRNQPEVAELLLAHGADVNSLHHENGYTALMFAALSGSPDITKLMLEHGARKDHVNSVGRNASQMAAFVGQHECVAVINNFYAKEDLEYFTKVQGLEKEPKLPYVLVPGLLKLLNGSNMHPVKLSMILSEYPGLLEESYKVCKVLEVICEKAMKARDTDDIMAMKAHYFATLIRHAKDSKDINTWIKSLLKGRDEDGYPEKQDKLIRQALKDFPYAESQLLQSMVRQLATVKIGDHPSSLNVLMQAINGQKFVFEEYQSCTTCGHPMAMRKCSACKMVYYCNQECQKLHWFTHKKFCKQMAEMANQIRQQQREQNSRKYYAKEQAEKEGKANITEQKDSSGAENKQSEVQSGEQANKGEVNSTDSKEKDDKNKDSKAEIQWAKAAKDIENFKYGK